MSSNSAEHLIGTILDRKYKLVRQLGDGGMAYVFAAERMHIGDVAAIKLHHDLAKDPIKKRRFQLEAFTTAAVKHPNVVSIFDYDETEEAHPYLVLELLNGPTLSKQIQRGQILPVRRAIEIISPVCAALNLAHQKGILHRDLKPSNIVLHHLEDGTEVVKLIDFGIVKMLNESDENPLTQQGFVVGTPEYLSPERYSGRNIDARSDIYSLGVLMYRMLTGRVPFSGRSATEILQKHVKQPVPPISLLNESVPEEVEQVVLRALAKRPEERFSTSTEFASALNEAHISSGDTLDHYSSSTDM
jgi:eukaryotic-like serine/threonine-protein kinase